MTTKSRRRVLKGLSAALPAVWARPVVEAVVLPAHAQTSTPVTTVSCGAPEGCYTYSSGVNSFLWPGGAGPYFSVPFYGNPGCAGEATGTSAAVLATSVAEAQAALGSSGAPGEIQTDTALAGGCSLFVSEE